MKIAVKNLQGYYKNPRRGNVELIAESLKELGQYRSIVVNKGTLTGRPNEVLVGNHTLLAAKKNKLTSVECKVIDVDEETAAKIVLADNRTSDNGTYDDPLLLELLEGLDDYTATGYSDNDIDDLLVRLEPATELPEVGVSKFADTAVRAMYVTYTLDEYVAIQEQLDALMAKMGLTSSAAVVAALAREAVEGLT